jgi:ABC-type methionine transport system ATPase subunit
MVKFFHVARSYGGREVLADVSLTVGNGEAVIVSGSGGAGKTTLVRLLLGLERPSRGWVTVDGLVVAGSAPDVLAAHRRRIGLIPQAPTLLPDRDVLGNVALAQEVAGVPSEHARQGALRTLERLGMDAMAERSVGALSGAERRWVAVARALGRSEASLLVVDEPASDLGAESPVCLGELLDQERDLGKTILVLSRTPELDGLGAHRVAFLDSGRITLDVSAPWSSAVGAPS